MRTTTLAAALAAAILVAGCGGDDDSSSSGTSGANSIKPTTTDSITISDFLYKPDPTSVRMGQKLVVVNDDDAPHTVTDKAEKRAFDSGTIKGKASGSVTFSKAGTFTYFCEFHPTMRGTVTVLK